MHALEKANGTFMEELIESQLFLKVFTIGGMAPVLFITETQRHKDTKEKRFEHKEISANKSTLRSCSFCVSSCLCAFVSPCLIFLSLYALMPLCWILEYFIVAHKQHCHLWVIAGWSSRRSPKAAARRHSSLAL